MGIRSRTLLALFAAAMVACTGGPRPTSHPGHPKNGTPATTHAPSDVLFLSTDAGLQALDPSTGRILFEAAGVVPSPDWSVLVTSRHRAGMTTVRSSDALTGETQFTRRVKGDLVTSAVASDGSAAALVDPGATTFPAVPAGRAMTNVVVADLYRYGSLQRFRLEGNFQPEAFSADGSRLFLFKYLPALAPDHYRVMWLDLANGRVRPTFGREKFPTGTMTGTRVMHVFAPSGDRLYTLYTNQPGAYSETDEYGGADSTPNDSYGTQPARTGKWSVAFIHTLFLESGLAICVNLPDAFGPGSARAKTLAVSPDGKRIYAIDAQRNLLTVLRAHGPRVETTTHVDLGSAGAGTAVAATGADGAVYVGWNGSVVAIDPGALTVRSRWQFDGRVTGLALDPEGRRLYVALGDRVVALDPGTGNQVASIPTPGARGISFVAAAA
jgi:hypothetical protein